MSVICEDGMTRDLPAGQRAEAGDGARMLSGFADLPLQAKQALYSGVAEGPDFFTACEKAPLDAFSYRAIVARSNGAPLMAAPVFEAAFRYDMSWNGPLRRVTEALHARAPKLVALPVIGLGSPHADELALGTTGGLGDGERSTAFGEMLATLEADARERGTEVLFVKDITDRQALWADDVLRRAGFSRLPTLPVAHLHLKGETEADYIASLSSNMRSNLRRKLKRVGDVETVVGADARDVRDELNELRRATIDKADTEYGAFEELSPDFFVAIQDAMSDRSLIILYRTDGKLIGFSHVLIGDDRVNYKYTGMRYPEARDHNLYFLNWMTLVRLCLERGIKHLHAGETAYLTKTRLGCVVERSWIYFKHTNRFVNPLFRAIGPRIRIDRMDEDVKRLGDQMPYIEPAGTHPV